MSADNTGVWDIPGQHLITFQTKSHLAATATEDLDSWRAPAACKVTAIWWTPSAAITGDNTNYTHLSFINRGTAGLGTTVVGHRDFTTGNDGVASSPIVIVTGAASTLTAFTMAAGEVLAVSAVKGASGLLIPSGTVSMTVTPL